MEKIEQIDLVLAFRKRVQQSEKVSSRISVRQGRRSVASLRARIQRKIRRTTDNHSLESDEIPQPSPVSGLKSLESSLVSTVFNSVTISGAFGATDEEEEKP